MQIKQIKVIEEKGSSTKHEIYFDKLWIEVTTGKVIDGWGGFEVCPPF